MDAARITEILTDPVTLDLVDRQPIMQVAYAAADGSPRAVPIGYLLREGKFHFFTIPTSHKVAALHRDSRIALTIDVYPQASRDYRDHRRAEADGRTRSVRHRPATRPCSLSAASMPTDSGPSRGAAASVVIAPLAADLVRGGARRA